MDTRNDVHAPSKINPDDYRYVGQEYMRIDGFGDCVILQEMRRVIREDMARTGGTYSGHEHGGNCMVCGSVNAIYTVLFHHATTNSYVRMGQDCAEKCEVGNPDAFRTFRESIKAAEFHKAGKAKAKGLLEMAGLSRSWEIYLEPRKGLSENQRSPWEESTTADIVGKLVQYGSASDKQYNFLRVLLQKIDGRAAVQAKRDADNANAKDCRKSVV